MLCLVGAAGLAYALWPTARPDVMKGQRFNCWKVGQCTEQCGYKCPDDLKKYDCLIGCMDRCRVKGCPSAKKAYNELTACVRKRCLFPCLGGPGTKCNGCTDRRCTKLALRCKAHKCSADE